MPNTIIMIHGMWGGGWYWDKLQEYFENKGYKCLAPYLRHHDVSPDAPPPPGLGKTSLLDYAEDLENEINKLDEQPIIMGHSMGGLLAQILAGRGLAKAAVLIASVPPAGIFAIRWSVLKSFSETLFKWGFWKNHHKLSFEKAEYAMMEKLPEAEKRYIYDRSVWESGRAATEIGFWFFGLKGAQVASSTLTCPVLVISGAEDNTTPAKVGKKIADRYRPFSTYLNAEGHAHWIIREPGWQKVAADIHAWLVENTE